MYPNTDSSKWGIGYIGIPDGLVLKGITCVTKNNCYIGKGLVRFSPDSTVQLDHKDYTRIGVYNRDILLKVFKINNTLYEVCTNTLSESIWIDFSEITSKGLYFNTYLFLLSDFETKLNDKFYNIAQNVNIGVNLKSSCLNLRTKPSLDGEIITCLMSNERESYRGQHMHLEILWFSDDWAFVIARKYEYEPKYDESGEGCSFKVILEYRGYVKAIDDKGRPNIWFTGN